MGFVDHGILDFVLDWIVRVREKSVNTISVYNRIKLQV